MSTISHIRRISTSIDGSTGKLIQPRKLSPTTWGYICPSETPEGQSIGLIKNLSIMAEVTLYTNSQVIVDIIEKNILPHNEIDIYSFNNRRVLHGRKEYDPNSGERHLQGYYIDRDEIIGRLNFLNKINP